MTKTAIFDNRQGFDPFTGRFKFEITQGFVRLRPPVGLRRKRLPKVGPQDQAARQVILYVAAIMQCRLENAAAFQRRRGSKTEGADQGIGFLKSKLQQSVPGLGSLFQSNHLHSAAEGGIGPQMSQQRIVELQSCHRLLPARLILPEPAYCFWIHKRTASA